MAEASAGRTGIEALVALSLAEGDSFDAKLHAEDAKVFEMTRPMSPMVRQAGERDGALAYAQTLGREPPREGFIDEATDAIVTFPFSPEAIAAARAEAAAGTSWWTVFAPIPLAIGAAVILKGVVYGAFDAARLGAGLVFVAVAVLMFRRGSKAGKKTDPR